VSLKPGHMDGVRDFDSMLNLFSLPSPPHETTACSWDGFRNDHWPCPRNSPLVNGWWNQSLAAATIPQRFGHCICSKLKYVECTKYVRVQAWTRACEEGVYVVCAPVWFIKWVVIVMVMFHLHTYQTATRTGALHKRNCAECWPPLRVIH
jgi:hypothetical protein